MLAAGVLGVVDGHQSDASAYVTSLRQLDPVDPANTGRGAVLAGRALADIGLRNVNRITRRDVMSDLRLTMQDLHPDTERPNDPPVVIPRLRYAAGEAWDELGGLPERSRRLGAVPEVRRPFDRLGKSAAICSRRNIRSPTSSSSVSLRMEGYENAELVGR